MMKKLSFTTVLFVFLLFIFNGIQGQTTQTQLDQVKLMRQYFGTWETVVNKDTTTLSEFQQYGSAFEIKQYYLVNGKKSLDYVTVFGFSPEEGKLKGFAVLTNGTFGTWYGSFVTDKKFTMSVVKDFNPEIVYSKTEITYDTPTTSIAEYYNSQGIKLGELKGKKIK